MQALPQNSPAAMCRPASAPGDVGFRTNPTCSACACPADMIAVAMPPYSSTGCSDLTSRVMFCVGLTLTKSISLVITGLPRSHTGDLVGQHLEPVDGERARRGVEVVQRQQRPIVGYDAEAGQLRSAAQLRHHV